MKAVFPDSSLCVAPPQKHVRKDTRLSSGRAWHAPCVLVNYAKAFVVGKLQHTTIRHECKWRWRRVFRTWDPGENILANSDSRCEKTEQRQAEARQVLVSQVNHDRVAHFRDTWPSFNGFQDSVRRVPHVLSEQAPPLSCKHPPVGQRSKVVVCSISSSTGLLTPSLPILASK